MYQHKINIYSLSNFFHFTNTRIKILPYVIYRLYRITEMYVFPLHIFLFLCLGRAHLTLYGRKDVSLSNFRHRLYNSKLFKML